MSGDDAKPSSSKRQGRGSRRIARELAMQALYQRLLSGDEVDALLAQAADKDEFKRADQPFLQTLLRGVVARMPELDNALQPFLDRRIEQLSPIERALLLMAAYELTVSLDVLYRVAINEAVELAKAYGGTDGYKYVNGVLDKLAGQLRPAEVRKN